MKTIKLLSTLLLFVSQVNAQTLVMETGVIDVNHNATRVEFKNIFVDPVVIANLPSYGGGQEVIVRVSNVTGTGCDLRLQEPVNRNDKHTFEKVHYIVVEKGNYVFEDGTMLEAGTISKSDLGFEKVSLLQTYESTPCVFTQLQTDNSSSFLKTRQNNSTTNDFEVKIEREEVLNTTGFDGTEEIGYFAITKGSGLMDGVAFEAKSFTASTDVSTQAFDLTFDKKNHFIGSISTFNEADPVALRWNIFDMEVSLEEESSMDAENDHVEEEVNFFYIDDNGGDGIYLPFLMPIDWFQSALN